MPRIRDLACPYCGYRMPTSPGHVSGDRVRLCTSCDGKFQVNREMQPHIDVSKGETVQPFRRDKLQKSITVSLRKLHVEDLVLGSTELIGDALYNMPLGFQGIVAKDRTRTAITDVCTAINHAGVGARSIVPSDVIALAVLARLKEISTLAYARYCVFHKMFRTESPIVGDAKKRIAGLVTGACGSIDEPNGPVPHARDLSPGIECRFCRSQSLAVYNTKPPGATSPLRRYVRCLKCGRNSIYSERFAPLFWLDKGGGRLEEMVFNRLELGIKKVTAKLARPNGDFMDEGDAYRIARHAAQMASKGAMPFPISEERGLLVVSSRRLSQSVASTLLDSGVDELASIRHALHSSWTFKGLQSSGTLDQIIKVMDEVAEAHFGVVPESAGGHLNVPPSLIERIAETSVNDEADNSQSESNSASP